MSVDYGYLGAISITLNLAAAVLLGGCIGIERQLRQRYTGLTTHALVALGAAAFTSLAGLVDADGGVRMGAQVVTGIGFLGAGLIMRDGLSVRGLSGAATLWATGAVGTLAGYGFLLEALETTLFIIAINLALPRLSWIIDRLAPDNDQSERYYLIELKCARVDEAEIRSRLIAAFDGNELYLHSLESHALKESPAVEVEATVSTNREVDALIEGLVSQFVLSPKVFSIRWTSTRPPE